MTISLTVEPESEQEILWLVEKIIDLKLKKFYGETRQSWKDGKIEFFHENRSFKLQN